MGLSATQSSDTPIKSVIFHVSFKPSGNLLLAELEDGRLCLLRDDLPLPDCVWDPDDVATAVTTYRDILVQLRRDTER